MSWSEVITAIEGAAPTIAGLIGGPAGVAVSAGASLLASALGVKPQPDDILAALKTNPDALVKVKQAELDNKVQLQQLAVQASANQLAADTQRIQAVNVTMQAEAKSEHWAQWAWRPFNGFAFGITLFFNYALPALMNALAPIFINDWKPVVSQVIPEFVFIAWGAVLGVTAWHRGVMQRIQAGSTSPAVKPQTGGLA